MTFRAAIAGAALLSLFMLQSGVGIVTESIAWDEAPAIASAWLCWDRGDCRILRERPPLMGALYALAFRLNHGKLAVPAIPDPDDRGADVHFARAWLWESGNDGPALVRSARTLLLCLSVLLGVVLWQWAEEIGGRGAGLLALALFALCPNLLAHSRIAANDMPLAIFGTVLLWRLDRLVRNPDGANARRAGLALGATLAAKLSGVLYLPAVALALGLAWIGWRRHGDGRTGEAPHPLFLATAFTLLAFLSLGVALGGRFEYAAWLRGFSSIYSGNNPGYQFYLGGEFSTTPFPHYYLYAAAIKTPIPLLVLALSGLIALARRRDSWPTLALVATTIAAVVGSSLFDAQNLGLRRILPVYPLLVLLGGCAATLPVARLAGGILVSLLLAWQALSLAAAGNHHLSYFNELVGGPAGGLAHLDDSNIDWGQDLPRLALWLRHARERERAGEVRADLFTCAPPEAYGVEVARMAEEEICSPRPAVYAISAHHLVRYEKFARRYGSHCSWLTREPIDRIGWSIWIYDLRKPSP